MSRTPVFLLLLCIGLTVANVSKRKAKAANLKRQAASGACAVDEFRCTTTHVCIPQEWVCDTDKDCRDHSDEASTCPTDCSGPHQFKCGNGDCVPIEVRCDGDPDCHDGKDEHGCAEFQCTSGEVHCDNGHGLCIENYWLCDGDDDCGTGWDEVPANCAAHGISTTPAP